MQWVVTTGPTVAEAKARALDALGIDETELDFEVLDEPRRRLFGLRSTEARVRARVRPTRPRPKVDRRNRRTNRGTDKRKRRPGTNQDGATTDGATTEAATARSEVVDQRAAGTAADRTTRSPRAGAGRSRSSAGPTVRSEQEPESSPPGTGGAAAMSDISLDTQEPTALDFVRGLVDAFGATADVTAERDDEDDAIEVQVEGDDLGLLVGPRGTTLAAIAELTRTAVAQQHSGRLEGRLRVDVAGYRARRKEALVRFANQVAEQVLDSGEAKALEPMSPPDRKIVHDAVNDIDGVRTVSRGEDRHRHVVIEPGD